MVELLSLLMKFVGNMPHHIDKETIICEIKIKTHKLKCMHISSYICQNDNPVYNTCAQDIKVVQLESLNFDFAVYLLCGCHCRYKLNHIPETISCFTLMDTKVEKQNATTTTTRTSTIFIFTTFFQSNSRHTQF